MFEIHLIDRERFAEGRAFYFLEPAAETGVAIPAPNDCLQCHHEHAAFDGTFTQFYPPLRPSSSPGGLTGRPPATAAVS